MTKFGLLSYKYPQSQREGINVGDYIQSLAAKQYLPQVDEYIDRENISHYSGEKIKIIMNGWFIHSDNFPPSSAVNPLFVAFHLDREELLTSDTIEYLKQYQPIGCRDLHTLELMQKYGIKSYFSACLTLTLQNTIQNNSGMGRTDEIIFVDVATSLETQKAIEKTQTNVIKILKKLIDKKDAKALRNINYVTHQTSFNSSQDERFIKAEYLLGRYSAAKLVVTSRIHAALPCLALGTPVVFVNERGNERRYGGLTDFFNIINFSENRLSYRINKAHILDNKGKCSKEIVNPMLHLKYVEHLRQRCKNFVSESL